jgi:hypothetical protein
MWSKNFTRSEEALKLCIKNHFNEDVSDDLFKKLRYAYLLGRLDKTLEEENSVVSSRYNEIYPAMQD